MASNVFCKVDKIPGEAKQKKDYFEVLSWTHGVSQGAAGSVQGSGGHIGGRPDFSEIVVEKQVDKASPDLFKACAKGTAIDSIVIEFYKNIGSDEPSKYLEYKLTKAVVRSIALSAGPSDVARETLTLGCSKLEWTYIEYGDDHKKVSEPKGCWDLELNKPC
jgi:type VI secretion system secreted protein Hcp